LLHLVPLLIELGQVLCPKALVGSEFRLRKVLASGVHIVLSEAIVGVGKIRIQLDSTLILRK
jgi:hypothetical protein